MSLSPRHKGDLYPQLAGIAKDYTAPCGGHWTAQPTAGRQNLLHWLTVTWICISQIPIILAYKARAEKYAKITAKTIINSGGFDTASAGQNRFLLRRGEGL
jgi:type IV secretion system protein VirD4